MNINTLTIKAQELLQGAMALARERKQQAVEPLHIAIVATKDEPTLPREPTRKPFCSLKDTSFCAEIYIME